MSGATPTPCVLAASTHYALAEIVVVSVRDGAPILRERGRVRLIEAGLPTAPYHHEALHMDLAEAEPIVSEVRRSVSEHARRAVADLRARHALVALAVEASPFPEIPESLADVLASSRLTYAADGMLYREAIADAGAAVGLEVVRPPRKTDAFGRAAEALGVPRKAIASLVADLGKSVGPPWRKDHKEATATALAVLRRYTDIAI